MPRKSKWRKTATDASLILGLVASIPINIITFWFQQDILSNIVFSIFIMLLLVAVFLSVLLIRNKALKNAFLVLVVSVFLNIFSSWVQDNILHDSFNLLNIAVIILFTIGCLIMSAYIAGHPITKTKMRLARLYRQDAKSSVYRSRDGNILPKKRLPTRRRKTIRY